MWWFNHYETEKMMGGRTGDALYEAEQSRLRRQARAGGRPRRARFNGLKAVLNGLASLLAG